MSHYKSNLRDLEFNLFEFLNVQKAMGTGPYVNVDEDQARMLLDELNRFASDSIWADSFVPADRTPLVLEDGDITLPDELREALEAYYDASWHLMPLPEHLGGVGAPPSVRWAASELMFGGHATAALWPIGPLFGWILDGLGTEGQKKRFVPGMVNDRWGATMVLTEPDAGSDVGAGVTKAVKVEENGPDDIGSVWHIEGVKRFITSADADIHPNTVHLVLARPDGGKPGTKGLRLFIVPKFLVNEDGSLGDRNGVTVTNVEKKMGIKGSATCELTMGGDPDLPCIGYLVGEADEDGSGIAQMFRVIEYARMTVGTKAMATLSTGYLNALEYAKVREQGPDMTDMGNKVDKVTIIHHPDVRRILMEQKAHVEGMRALVMYTGWVQDQAELNLDDHDVHTDWLAREDLLLPLVKGYCSEKAYELLALSLQTFGGSGFTQDYPIEQYIRDAKIDTLYEGTTAIQGLDLLFRKIVKDQGATLTWFAEQAKEVIKGAGADDPFVAEREMLGTALDDVQAHLGVLIGHAMKSLEDEHKAEIYKAGLNSTEFLYSLAEVFIGWLLLAHAEVAHEAIAAGSDEEFYVGKVASARWFARNVLPKVAMRRGLAEAQDGALMDVPEGAF